MPTPKHYDFTIEPLQAIRSWGLGFELGNVVKYISRAAHKGDEIGDLEKAKNYLDGYIQWRKEQTKWTP